MAGAYPEFMSGGEVVAQRAQIVLAAEVVLHVYLHHADVEAASAGGERVDGVVVTVAVTIDS